MVDGSIRGLTRKYVKVLPKRSKWAERLRSIRGNLWHYSKRVHEKKIGENSLIKRQVLEFKNNLRSKLGLNRRQVNFPFRS